MRILMLSDTYFPRISGVATSIRSFRRGLQGLGHTVDLLVPDYGSSVPNDDSGIMRVPAWKTGFLSRRAIDVALGTPAHDP